MDELKIFNVNKHTKMCSFHIVNLYTNMPKTSITNILLAALESAQTYRIIIMLPLIYTLPTRDSQLLTHNSQLTVDLTGAII
jgi:hypothetical protein